MSDVTQEPAAAPADRDRVLRADVEAARERQSHVRHELRAPLAVIYPLLELLLDGDAGEITAEQRGYLQALERSAVRLEGLISSAADSGWPDCSATPVMRWAVDLGVVLDEVLMVRRVRRRTEADVVTRVLGDSAPTANADRDDARQIIANLLANAAAFTPPAGSVAVTLQRGREAGAVLLSVADTGPGIPADELPHVFDFGFRGVIAQQLNVPGLGAGLWVSRELARRNGGDVVVASDASAGTTVTVSLPAAAGGLE